MIHNPNCDGDKCTSETGEVRVLPMGKQPHHGNLILCQACFNNELNWRRQRNRQLGKNAQFSLPAWNDLQVYG
jgi:hypothetical protein